MTDEPTKPAEPAEKPAKAAAEEPADKTLAEKRPAKKPAKKPVKKNTSRARLVFRTVAVVVVLVAGWMAVLVGAQILQRGKTYSFREETLHVLKLMRAQKADQLYNEASPLLRQSMIRSVFADTIKEVQSVMGKFQRIIRVAKAEVNKRPTGTTGFVVAEVEFSQATTICTFSYHRVDGQWRLLHFQINLPLHRIGAAKRKDSLLAPKTAPEQVHRLVRQIMQSRMDGTTAVHYDDFHPKFKESVSLDKFVHLLDARVNKLGAFKRVLEIRNSSLSKGKTSAWVDAVLEYADRKTIGKFGFDKIEAKWRLKYFKVLSPDPGVDE